VLTLPHTSGRQAVRAFEKSGFEVRHQRGSHIILAKAGFAVTLAVPNHRELEPGTLRALIRAAGLTVEEFVDLLS